MKSEIMKKVKIKVKTYPFPYKDAFKEYKKITKNGKNIGLLMESRSKNLGYGKESIIVPNPAVRISCIKEKFKIQALTKNGEKILSYFNKKDFEYVSELTITKKEIKGIVKKENNTELEENKRSSQKNVSSVLKTILNKFECENNYCGLYGAFSYDFSKNFYNVEERFIEETNDFVLFLPTTIIAFDDIKEKAQKIEYNFGTKVKEEETKGFEFIKQEKKIEYDLTDEQYLKSLKNVIEDIKNGRAMQCVLSRKISMTLQRHPIESYEELREKIPAPYSYYYNLGENEVLYGASPEIHIKISKGEIEIRPLAGTVQRQENPLEDAEARIHLLTDEKEKREHTMLVDLARHELYNLCEAKSVRIDELFILEEYPNLYHLVSDIKGNLKKEKNAIDALLITLPAGTLSGAPKQESMKMIEEYEGSKRGYYGGAIGYIAFNGECNTGITIRSIHVKNNKSNIRGGGGVIALSTPEQEFNERKLKLEKTLEVLEEARK